MVWVDIVLTIIFILSFIGGVKEGAVKAFFSVLSLIISIPLTGIFYHLLRDVLTFIPDENWLNFVSFFITFIIINIILGLIFILPVKLIEGIWNKGIIFTILGGFFGVLAFAISLVLFAILVETFPIFYWLEQALINSRVIDYLMTYMGFIRVLLPEVFSSGHNAVISGLQYLKPLIPI